MSFFVYICVSCANDVAMPYVVYVLNLHFLYCCHCNRRSFEFKFMLEKKKKRHASVWAWEFFSYCTCGLCVCVCVSMLLHLFITCFTSSSMVGRQWPCPPATSHRLHPGRPPLYHQRSLHTCVHTHTHKQRRNAVFNKLDLCKFTYKNLQTNYKKLS